MRAWIEGETMNRIWKLTAVASLALLVSAALPRLAAAADAQLYELTENMRLVGKTARLQSRNATSQLMGFARRGTALCPENLIQALIAQKLVAPDVASCAVNATGSDNISMATGKGKFRGMYTIVVQGDNPVDAAEYVVDRGRFSGLMDFSPAILGGQPYGTVAGALFSDTGDRTPFSGVFRLPFLYPPVAGDTPLYIDDNGVPFPVGANEYSLGEPTVRFDITF